MSSMIENLDMDDVDKETAISILRKSISELKKQHADEIAEKEKIISDLQSALRADDNINSNYCSSLSVDGYIYILCVLQFRLANFAKFNILAGDSVATLRRSRESSIISKRESFDMSVHTMEACSPHDTDKTNIISGDSLSNIYQSPSAEEKEKLKAYLNVFYSLEAQQLKKEKDAGKN